MSVGGLCPTQRRTNGNDPPALPDLSRRRVMKRMIRAAVAAALVAGGTGCTLTEKFTDHRGKMILALGRLGRGVTDVENHNRRGMEETLARIKAAVA